MALAIRLGMEPIESKVLMVGGTKEGLKTDSSDETS